MTERHKTAWPIRYQHDAECWNCKVGTYRPFTFRCGCVVLYCQSCGDHEKPDHEAHRGKK